MKISRDASRKDNKTIRRRRRRRTKCIRHNFLMCSGTLKRVELNGLFNVECFEVLDEKDTQKGRKVVGIRYVYTFQRR